MFSLSDDKQAEVIVTFKSTSKYLDDLLNIDNHYFIFMVKQIHISKLNIANASDTEDPLWMTSIYFLQGFFYI